MKLKFSALLLICILAFSFVDVYSAECSGACSSCDAATKAEVHKTDNAEDEFEPFDAQTDSKTSTQSIAKAPEANQQQAPSMVSSITEHRLFVPAIAVLLSILAGFIVKSPKLRWLKPLFLISSIAFFGFYNGGCPCPISSFQETLLLPFGVVLNWESVLWFVALIPVTYLLGQTWCGWVCHLGAVQEFIFRQNRFERLKSDKAQKIMKNIRVALFVVLIAQLAATQTNMFCMIDPFKALFNLSSPHTASWVLLVLLIISSMFIYRPFCRAVCPIGLTLGLVSLIPGAHKVKRSEHCTGCKTTSKKCNYQAVTTKDGKSIIKRDDCLNCGDCYASCVDKCSIRKSKLEANE